MCVKEGKAASIMTAYNALNDVPCTLNAWLLKKVLRQDWGFQGYVVSDCGGPSLLVNAHKYVKRRLPLYPFRLDWIWNVEMMSMTNIC